MTGVPLRALMAAPHEPETNNAMVEDLYRAGTLRSAACLAAFKAVDRAHFWVQGTGSVAYADVPLRHGKLHQSAPHIYARALEALMPLQPGLSFLNIGSGTGYFSCLVGHLIGPQSVNDGLELWQETVAHAQERSRLLGFATIEYTVGNAYEMDVNAGMRYDRIYVGAGASARARYFYHMLEVGGILVGPFQDGHGQQLERVVRESATRFKVHILSSVHFAPLVEPIPMYRRAPGVTETPLNHPPSGEAFVEGLPGVPFRFALRQQPWTPQQNSAFPLSFRKIVAELMRSNNVSGLPADIWLQHVLPWCPRWWFEASRNQGRSSAGRAMSALATAKEKMMKAFLCARGFGPHRNALPVIVPSYESERAEMLSPLLEATPASGEMTPSTSFGISNPSLQGSDNDEPMVNLPSLVRDQPADRCTIRRCLAHCRGALAACLRIVAASCARFHSASLRCMGTAA